MEIFEPPCVVKDVISHVFLFDNLHSYLVYLEEKSKRAFSQIYDLNTKVSELLALKEDVKELHKKFEMLKFKQEEMNTTINYHSRKIMDIELSQSLVQERVSFVEKEQSNNNMRFENLENNIQYLTKVVEETTKNVEKINITTLSLKATTDSHSLKIENTNDKIVNICSDVEKSLALGPVLEDFKTYSTNKFQTGKQKRKMLQNKVVEIELGVSRVYDLFSELSMETKNKKNNTSNGKLDALGLSGENQANSLQNPENNYLTNLDFSIFKTEYEELKLKFENFLKDFNNPIQISSDDKKIDDTKNNLFREDDTSLFGNFKRIKKEDISNEVIVENLNSIQENMQLFMHNLSLKANKDDLDRLIKHIFNDLEKFQAKINDFINKVEMKLKNTSVESSVSHDKQEIIKIVEKLAKESISNDLNHLINESLVENYTIKKFIVKSEINSEEIEKLSKMILEIKNVEKDEEEPSIEKTENNNNQGSKIIHTNQNNINEIKFKLSELEGNLLNLNEKLDHNIRGTIKEDEDEKTKEELSLNLRDYIKNVYMNVKNVSERLDKLSFRQDGMNTDILAKVKKDLTSESNRILDEFRADLKLSIGKIEDQLREKVDRFNLDDFSKRMDNKFSNEISKKIDKHDLKKNNVQLNKKLDNFENKISKTLVDTLIDLQMEEAPLIIVKKGAHNDKCGSCNQYVPLNANATQTSFNQQMGLFGNSYTEDNSRFKLRAIQDISNKFGTGSYSRILNNINTDTLNEDLKSNFKMVSNSLQLPHIRNKSNLNTPRRKNQSLGKIEEFPERYTLQEEEKKLSSDIIVLKKEKKK